MILHHLRKVRVGFSLRRSSRAPWWQVLHTKTIARKNYEGWDTFQPPRVPLGRKKLQKSQKWFALTPLSWWKNDSDDLPKPPGGKYCIPKRLPRKIKKVETLSNHLEYHWDPKNCKNHKNGSFWHHCFDGKINSDDLPKPPGGKYGIPKRLPWKIRKVETSQSTVYHRDAKNSKNHEYDLLRHHC